MGDTNSTKDAIKNMNFFFRENAKKNIWGLSTYNKLSSMETENIHEIPMRLGPNKFIAVLKLVSILKKITMKEMLK